MNERTILLIAGGLFVGFGVGALGIDAAAFVIASLIVGIGAGVGLGLIVDRLMNGGKQ